jgi:hypothetical protein
MDFSWDWVKRGLAITTQPPGQAKQEIARAAMLQATLRAAVGIRLVLETLEQGL